MHARGASQRTRAVGSDFRQYRLVCDCSAELASPTLYARHLVGARGSTRSSRSCHPPSPGY